MVQRLNANFSEELRKSGHTYFIERTGYVITSEIDGHMPIPSPNPTKPVKLSRNESLRWVVKAIIRNRGRELQGNFNPLIIRELFWEQSGNKPTPWADHIEDVVDVCRRFLHELLQDLCPKDVQSRLSSAHIEDAVRARSTAAVKELEQLLVDLREHPIKFNHYYTETIEKCRMKRESQSLATCVENATIHTPLLSCQSTHSSARIDIDRLSREFGQSQNPDMDVYVVRLL
ncbi:dynamin family protein [Paraphaeosphaeria minitans]|uniref:Dynamin family protein n=1 Tax=Paraphaeosphaeria minitans TaxID=565426 RepID=A0A9P6GEN9_9PLEO|nr:dynamin family protein [Paraphaeosphaeria minitans]